MVILEEAKRVLPGKRRIRLRLLPKLQKSLNKLRSFFADLIFPPVCLSCGRKIFFFAPFFFCKTCLKNFPWINSTSCSDCGRHIPAARHFQTSCKICRTTERFFQSSISALNFVSPVKDLLLEMKYCRNPLYVKGLSRLLIHALKKIQRKIPPWDAVTYVPAFPLKDKERGFNQSALLAREVARYLNLPLITVLKKTKEGQPQASLSLSGRALNVAGTFQLNPRAPASYNHVLLVDDVMTTGSTLNECARELSLSGIPRVSAASLMSVPEVS